MAVKFITAVWETAPYKAEKLLVLLALADWSNDKGTCFPSYRSIAHKARVTREGAIQIVKSLIADGAIEIAQAGGPGRGNHHIYQLLPSNWPKIVKGNPEKAIEDYLSQPEKGNPEKVIQNGEKVIQNEIKGNPEPDSYNKERARVFNRQGTVIEPSEIEPSNSVASATAAPDSLRDATVPVEPISRRVSSEKHRFKNETAIVFAHWQAVMESPQSKFTPERKTKIEARLKDGYTVEQIMQAIDGCRGSAFHMGENDRSTKYNDLTLICRDGVHLENFIGKIPVVVSQRKGGCEICLNDAVRLKTKTEPGWRFDAVLNSLTRCACNPKGKVNGAIQGQGQQAASH